uniref:RNA-directed DNA polymerase n=1 Tax=Trichuris muris TaxID=70415 RepID=A0A5S6Q0M3_TRIMR
MARPLHRLLKKLKPWNWDEDQEKAFRELKERMNQPPVLQHFHVGWSTELHCDASREGLGAVVMQSKNGEEHVVDYLSRMLTTTEQKYHSNELECLAVVWALRMVRSYVLGRKFKIVTDNSAVKWLFGRQETNDKFGRWVMAITEYLDDCEFVHRAGRANRLPDALSRAPIGTEADIVEEAMLCAAICDGVSLEELEVLQSADPELRRVRNCLDSDQTKAELDGRNQNVQKEFRLFNGILDRKNHEQGRPWRLAVPTNLRRNMVVSVHASPTAGHLGLEKTVSRLRKRYWWPEVAKMMREVVLACPTCQRRKAMSGKPAG